MRDKRDMAIDIEKMLIDAIVELSQEKPLKKVTVNDIVEKAGTGRQTFYNHFQNKEDLINCAYSSRTMGLTDVDEYDDYYDYLVETFRRFAKNNEFFIQAYKLVSYNSLVDHIQQHLIKFFTDYVISHYGESVLNEELKFAIEFNSYGAVNMLIKWHKEKMVLTPEARARYILNCVPDILKKYLPIRERERRI
jgi:AcrR family transcriptional regulator